MTNLLIYFLVRTLGFVSSHVRDKGRQRLSHAVAWIMIHLSSSRYKVTLENIGTAFPDRTDREVEEIAIQSYRNFAQCYVELFATPGLNVESIYQRFDFQSGEVLRRQAETGRGLILISAHIGNWEWAALQTAQFMKRSLVGVVKMQRNAHVSNYINRCRTSEWNGVVDMNTAARDIIGRLRRGEVVGMLIDQAADPRRDVFVDFFGRPAVTFEAPASLAIRYDADLIVGLSVRNKDGNYVMHFIPVEHRDVAQQPDAVKTIVQRCTSVIEAVIRQYPEQRSWQHKRWKYNPQDFQKGTQT